MIILIENIKKNIMKKQFNITCILMLSFLLIGCSGGRKDVEVAKSFFDKPSSVVIVQLQGLEDAVYRFRPGGRSVAIGLIPAVLDDHLSAGVKQIARIDASQIVEENYYKLFAASFENKNFKIVRFPSALNSKKLDELTSDNGNLAPFDFKFLREKYDTEYALVLHPQFFGATRAGIFWSPRALTILTMYLVKIQDNTIAAHYKASVEIKASDDWDKNPEYTGLVEVTKCALKQALIEAHTYFFNGGLKGVEDQRSSS